MPSRNTVRSYAADNYYHVYNRGVDKRVIFEDELDYKVFLSYFKVALSPDDSPSKAEIAETVMFQKLRRLRADKEVELLAFCLLPNHFHLLFYLHSEHGISKLMQSVMSGYVRYFNQRYDRVGGLFQGRYRSAHIDNEAYLWHISRYIHLNSIDAGSTPDEYEYSSFPYYMKRQQADWLKPQKILQLHRNDSREYHDFVHDYTEHKKELDQLKPYLADANFLAGN